MGRGGGNLWRPNLDARRATWSVWSDIALHCAYASIQYDFRTLHLLSLQVMSGAMVPPGTLLSFDVSDTASGRKEVGNNAYGWRLQGKGMG